MQIEGCRSKHGRTTGFSARMGLAGGGQRGRARGRATVPGCPPTRCRGVARPTVERLEARARRPLEGRNTLPRLVGRLVVRRRGLGQARRTDPGEGPPLVSREAGHHDHRRDAICDSRVGRGSLFAWPAVPVSAPLAFGWTASTGPLRHPLACCRLSPAERGAGLGAGVRRAPLVGCGSGPSLWAEGQLMVQRCWAEPVSVCWVMAAPSEVEAVVRESPLLLEVIL